MDTNNKRKFEGLFAAPQNSLFSQQQQQQHSEQQHSEQQQQKKPHLSFKEYEEKQNKELEMAREKVFQLVGAYPTIHVNKDHSIRPQFREWTENNANKGGQEETKNQSIVVMSGSIKVMYKDEEGKIKSLRLTHTARESKAMFTLNVGFCTKKTVEQCQVSLKKTLLSDLINCLSFRMKN